MIAREESYFEKFKMIGDVAQTECYMGLKNCSTCMYRKVDQNFENEYCLNALKEDKT
jgi:hypothetical protein